MNVRPTDPSEESLDSTSHPRWHVGEEPGFRSSLRRVEPGCETSAAQRLRLSAARRRIVLPPPRRPRPARKDTWANRLHLLPIVYLSALSLLGYAFATRSITAFSSAWRSTDTHALPVDQARPEPTPPATADPGSLEGPFGSISTRGDALQGLVPFWPHKATRADGSTLAAAPAGRPRSYQ